MFFFVRLQKLKMSSKTKNKRFFSTEIFLLRFTTSVYIFTRSPFRSYTKTDFKTNMQTRKMVRNMHQMKQVGIEKEHIIVERAVGLCTKNR